MSVVTIDSLRQQLIEMLKLGRGFGLVATIQRFSDSIVGRI